MATPLHNHSRLSLLDGLSSAEDISKRIEQVGFEAAGCTDHDVVAGHIEFFNALTDSGQKPILGIETYQTLGSRFNNLGKLNDKDSGWRADNFHLILLAMNDEGLRNLWAMNTEAHSSGFYYNGRVDWDLLEKFNEGIICTSACGLGVIQQALAGNPFAGNLDELIYKYVNIFGDRFYLELSTYPAEWQHSVNVGTVDLARSNGIPLVYANDAHYAFPEQYDLHEGVMALQMGKKLADSDRMSHEPALYIMDEDDVREHLSYLPQSAIDEAINNSDVIAQQCNVSLPERRFRIPAFIPDKEWKNSWDMFFDLAVDGYERKITKYDKDDEVYLERFRKEMQVIYDAGLHDYFLIVRDFVRYAKDNNIMVGPGRGSVGGSLIAYLLGITEIDPIRYGLIFERFYNAGREKSLPDIDVDFSKARREEVKEYVANKYGREYVSDIGTINTLQPKSSILDVGRVLGINMKVTRTVSNIIDKTIDAGLQPKWDEVIAKVGNELEPYVDEHPQLFDWAIQLYDLPRSMGIHPSGVIIGDEPLSYNFPLKWNAKNKKLVTQWDMDVADILGYMKADLLGLRTLDTLEEVNRILVERGKEPIDYEALQYQDHDEDMWSILDKGLTVGIFQIEDGTMARQLAKQIRPRSVEELAVLNAMNRPGPLRSGADKKYQYGKLTGDVRYLHSILEDVLNETYGVFLYQEQIIHYMSKIGYSLEEADEVRKIVGKKKKELMAEEHERYMERATDHMDKDTAQLIWDEIVDFAKYGFNKSHAIAYGIVQLWTIYAKWAHPAEFILAGIRTVKKEEVSRYVNEARRMLITVLAPDINRSDSETTLVGDDILYGFRSVKDIGDGPAKWLVEHQPYESMQDLETKIQEYKYVLPNGQKRVAVNKKQLDHILQLGGMVSIGVNPTVDYEELLDIEEELLGVPLSDDSATILEDHREALDSECVSFDEVIEEGQEYAVAGIIRDIHVGKTKNQQRYARVEIEDETGNRFSFAVWNTELDRLGFIWRHRTAGVFLIKNAARGPSLLEARILHKK